MRILIDTNIIIDREDDKILSNNLAELLRIVSDNRLSLIIHPLSVEEIKKDKNEGRRGVSLSKLKSYSVLESPPTCMGDAEFMRVVGDASNDHDFVDNNLLYCISRNAVDFLLTEDQGIHKKSERLGFEDRVLTISEALEFLKVKFSEPEIIRPYAIEQIPVYSIDYNDPILDGLKEDYKEFKDWWDGISAKRKAWVYKLNDDRLGALLILKEENEDIPDTLPTFPKKKRVKICTLIVTHNGYKIGEAFIKIAVDFAIKKDIAEMYLTHFTKTNDTLIPLIEQYGFSKKAIKKSENGVEDIFFKYLMPIKEIENPLDISEKYYPSFYDGEKVDKFIIPIQPPFHERLFPEYIVQKDQGTQQTLAEYLNMPRSLNVQGNSIRKAYISNAPTHKVSKGDILLFYRSQDIMAITSLGVVESVHYDLTDPDEIMRIVGKRTVYNQREIAEKAQNSTNPATVVLFTQNFHFEEKIKLSWMQREAILVSAPVTTNKMDHDKYIKVKKRGKINERFAFN